MVRDSESGPRQLSAHPADLLIRELVTTRRPALAEEVAAIVDRMATAPFDPRIVHVRVRDRGKSLHGRTLSSRTSALFYHLVKRIILDEQWTTNTTAEQYLADLRRAVTAKTARHMVYFDRGGHLAAAFVPTAEALIDNRQLPGTRDWLLVVYSADWGYLLSGYQVTGLSTVRLPWETLWLS